MGITLVEVDGSYPDLVVLNKGQPTRLSGPGKKISVVYITILTANFIERFVLALAELIMKEEKEDNFFVQLEN